MSKADELLAKSIEYVELMRDKNSCVECGFQGLSEHIDKVYEYLNRKDKLVVGSEWVCDDKCIGNARDWKRGDNVTIEKLSSTGEGILITYEAEKYLHHIYTDQFLACFVPKEKE